MADLPAGVFDHKEPGTIRCRADGCPNWLVKRSGRHMYCRAWNCTFSRRTPAMAPLVLDDLSGAAVEVLRRLQEDETAEVGPALLAERRQQVVVSLKAKDQRAAYGALVDEAVTCVWWADRLAGGEAVGRVPQDEVAAAKPVGLVHAVVSSHLRTVQLADQRVAALLGVMAAQDRLSSARLGWQQRSGRPDEPEARLARDAAVLALNRAQRAQESVEAAWEERRGTLTDLVAAAATTARAA